MFSCTKNQFFLCWKQVTTFSWAKAVSQHQQQRWSIKSILFNTWHKEMMWRDRLSTILRQMKIWKYIRCFVDFINTFLWSSSASPVFRPESKRIQAILHCSEQKTNSRGWRRSMLNGFEDRRNRWKDSSVLCSLPTHFTDTGSRQSCIIYEYFPNVTSQIQFCIPPAPLVPEGQVVLHDIIGIPMVTWNRDRG